MTGMTRRATLEVAGMTCTDCEHHVAAALERAGAGQALADFRLGVARFALPWDVDEAGLRAAVTQAGYAPGRLRTESPGAPAAPGTGDGDYDLLVLGAGSAAFAAAIRGRDAGYRVALAEAGTLGGTCVNVGCIPSKALLAAGAAYWAAGHPRFAGITTSAGPVDLAALAALAAQKDDLVAALLQEKYVDLVDAYGFEVLPGHAAFTVWAAGDVSGAPQFVYVSAYQGALAAGNALLGEGQEVDLAGLPRVIFTTPPAAGAGLTEAQARAAGYHVTVSVLPATAVPRALVSHDTSGVTKLVADAGTGELLGASVVGEGAGDVIQSAVLAIRHRITAAELAATFHPYLTTAESLKLAAQGFTRDVARLSCCAA